MALKHLIKYTNFFLLFPSCVNALSDRTCFFFFFVLLVNGCFVFVLSEAWWGFRRRTPTPSDPWGRSSSRKTWGLSQVGLLFPLGVARVWVSRVVWAFRAVWDVTHLPLKAFSCSCSCLFCRTSYKNPPKHCVCKGAGFFLLLFVKY